MQLKNLFSLALLFSLNTSCMVIIKQNGKHKKASRMQFINHFTMLPNEVLPLIASHFNIITIRDIKFTCKQFNHNIDYQHANSNAIKFENYDLCTDGLIYFAHQKHINNFTHLLQNKPKKREKALTLLGWHTNLSDTEQMNAYQGAPANQKPQSISHALGNTITLKIICCALNPNIRDKNKQTALEYACQNNKIHIIEQLLKNKNLDPNTKNTDGYTILHIACNKDDVEIIKLLLNNEKTDINLPINPIYSTVLDIACNDNKTEIKQLLLSKGARHSWLYYSKHAMYISWTIVGIQLIYDIVNHKQ